MSKDKLTSLSDFRVDWCGFGYIACKDQVDVLQANSDKIVIIECLSVTMYSENNANSPELGRKLKKPAIMTFCKIFPKRSSDKAKTMFEEKLYSW